MVFPRASQHGRSASTTVESPPIIIDNRASRAPTSPPDTGASKLNTPRSSARAAIVSAKDGSLVVMSTSTEPGFARLSVPFGPRTTSFTSLGYPTIVKMTSLACATAAGLSAHVPPRLISGVARDLVRE